MASNNKKLTCNLCNKGFSKRDHLESHMAKQKSCIEGKYKCKYCCRGVFQSANGLSNHVRNICDSYKEYMKNINSTENDKLKDEELKNEILLPHREKKEKVFKKLDKNFFTETEVMLMMENSELKNKLAMKDMEYEIKIAAFENDTLKKELSKCQGKTVVNNVNSNNINNTLINANNLSIQYIMNNYIQGKPLEPLENYNRIMDCNINNSINLLNNNNKGKRITIKNKKIAFVERLLNIEKTRLVEFVGDVIVAFYLNDDSSLQAMWATDITRLTFLAKFIKDETNEIEWKKDKSGEKVKNKIIEPLLQYINELIILYQKETDLTLNPDISLHCIDIQKLITNGSMAHNVLKYIAPKFSITHGRKNNNVL